MKVYIVIKHAQDYDEHPKNISAHRTKEAAEAEIDKIARLDVAHRAYNTEAARVIDAYEKENPPPPAVPSLFDRLTNLSTPDHATSYRDAMTKASEYQKAKSAHVDASMHAFDPVLAKELRHRSSYTVFFSDEHDEYYVEELELKS